MQGPGPAWPRLAVYAALTLAAYAAAAIATVALLPDPHQLLWRAGAVCALFLAGTLLVTVLTRHPSARATLTFASAVGTCASTFILFPSLGAAMVRFSTWSGPLTFFFPILGIQLMLFALRHRRTGDSLHCPACDYELGTTPDDAPPRCPECGHPWLGKWAKGRSRRSPRLAWAGALFALLGLAPVLMQWTGLGSASLSIVPTPMLTSLAATDPWGHNKGTWAELNNRTLTPAEHDLFAEKLLDLRLAHGYLYGEPAAWLAAAVRSGSLPAAMIERYYREWFEPRIAAPDAVALGEPIPLRLAAEERRGGPNTWMYIWVRSITVNGVPLNDEDFESTRKRWAFSLDFLSPKLPGPLREEPIPFPALKPTAPGVLEVTLTGYRCVVPSGTTPRPLDETTDAPPTGSIYFDRFEVSKSITVR